MSGGLITTRAASESNLGEDVAVQLLARVAAAGRRRGRAGRRSPLIPGLPKFSFLLVAAPARRPRPTSTDGRPVPTAAEPVARQRRRLTPSTRRRRSIRSASRSATRWSSIVDEKQGGTLLNRVRADPPADRHRNRRGRAAGARRRQPPARTARLRDSGQGRRSGARRVCSRPAARDQPGHRVGAPSRARRPASRRSACRPGGFRRAARAAHRPPGYTVVDPTTALSTHLSETIRNFLPDLLSRQQTKEMRRRRRRRRRRSWSRSWCRSSPSIGDIQRVLRQLLRERVPIRDLTTILEALADAAAPIQGSRRDHRSGARGDGPGHLPAVPERTRRAAGHQPRAGARGAAAVVDRADRARRRARARPDARAAPGVAHRRSARRGSGTARALVHASAASASVAALRSRAAAHRRAVARRGAAAAAASLRSPCWTDMYFKRFRSATVRDALRAAREELGPDALVLSTELVAGARMARLARAARGPDHRGGGARSVGAPTPAVGGATVRRRSGLDRIGGATHGGRTERGLCGRNRRGDAGSCAARLIAAQPARRPGEPPLGAGGPPTRRTRRSRCSSARRARARRRPSRRSRRRSVPAAA